MKYTITIGGRGSEVMIYEITEEQDDFEDDTEVVAISCGHVFSKEYFDLSVDKLRCAICRCIY